MDTISVSSLDESTKDIDYLLENVIGPAGLGQWIVVFAIFPIGFASGYALLIHMFSAYEPRHRCYIPSCDDEGAHSLDPNEFLPDWSSFTIPNNSATSEMLKVDESYDSCSMFQPIGDTCQPESFNTTKIIDCERYVYEDAPFTETLTTQVDLVCSGGETKRRLLSTFMMLGLMIGSLVGGRLADKYGRRKIMFTGITIIIPIQIFAGYCQSYWTYALLRLIVCAAGPLVWVASHSLTLELIGTSKRQVVVLVKDFVFPLSNVFVTLVYYLNRHWTYMHIWTGVISLTAWPCFFLIPESVRWLVLNGDKEKAKDILCTIAKRNGKKLNIRDKKEIEEVLSSVESKSKAHGKQEKLNPLDMFKGSYLKTTLIMLFNWITVCVAGYTLLLNATKLYGDVFVNFILVSIAGDLPGTFFLMFTLTYCSRKFNMFYCSLVTGISCIATGFIPKDYSVATTIFYLIGKCFSGMGFLLVWLVTAELYPTNLRGQAVGIGSTVSRVFGLVAPFMAKLSIFWKPLPMVLIGILALICASIVYFLPDTKNESLPQTMEDGKQMNKKTATPIIRGMAQKMSTSEKPSIDMQNKTEVTLDVTDQEREAMITDTSKILEEKLNVEQM